MAAPDTVSYVLEKARRVTARGPDQIGARGDTRMSRAKQMLSRLSRPSLFTAVALVGLGIVILFWPVFFEGKVLVPGDVPFSDAVWHAEAPAEYLPPQNPLLKDQVAQFYVWHLLASKSIQKDGKLPLWNPYIFTGQPLVANAQSALFYPPNLLLIWLSPGQVANVRAVFNLLIATAFTLLFSRELGISPKGSILAAIAFAFSGPLLVWLGHPHTNSLVWLPVALWAGEKLLHRSKPLLWVGILSLAVAMSILGGHPETSFHVLVVFGLYSAARLLLLKSSLLAKAKLMAALVAGVVLGMAIGGVQLLPFVDFLFQSATLAHNARSMGGATWLYSRELLSSLVSMVTLIYPNFFGNPINHNYQWPFDSAMNYNEQTAYIGLVPLALAAGALFAPTRRRRVFLIAAVALFCLGVALRLPGFELVNHLPVFSAATNRRLRMPFALMASVMAGIGFDTIRQHLAARRGRARSLYASGAVLFVTLAILLFVALLKYVGPLLFDIEPDSFLSFILYAIFSLHQPKTLIPAVAAVAAGAGYWLLSRQRPRLHRYDVLLIGLTLGELLVLGWGYNPVIREADILPPVQGLEVLRDDGEPFRIMATDQVFEPNYPAAFGLSDVAGYDLPVYLRYSDLYLAQGGVVDYAQAWQPGWPLVDFLNTRYIITEQELDAARFAPLYSTEGYTIYENTHALPRAFMVYHFAVIEDKAAILDRMLDGEWDPAEVAFLEEPLPSYEQESLRSESSFSIDTVRYEDDIVVLDVLTEQAGLLVMSDLFTGDWQVQVDGERVKLYRANYTYRALFVPEGRHEVRFTYAPRAFSVGVGLSFLGLILAGLLILVGRRQVQRAGSECRDS